LRGERILSVAFSPNGKLLAARQDDAKILVWNAVTGRVLDSFSRDDQSSRRSAAALAFSACSRFLAIGYATQYIEIRNLANGTLWKTLTLRDGRIVESVAFSRDAKLMLAVLKYVWYYGDKSEMVMLDIESECVVDTITTDGDKLIYAEFLGDSKDVIYTVKGRHYFIWKSAKSLIEPIMTLEYPLGRRPIIAQSHAGTRIVISPEDSHGIVIIDVGTGNKFIELPTWRIKALRFSADDSQIFVVCMEGALLVLDAFSGHIINTMNLTGIQPSSTNFINDTILIGPDLTVATYGFLNDWIYIRDGACAPQKHGHSKSRFPMFVEISRKSEFVIDFGTCQPTLFRTADSTLMPLEDTSSRDDDIACVSYFSLDDRFVAAGMINIHSFNLHLGYYVPNPPIVHICVWRTDAGVLVFKGNPRDAYDPDSSCIRVGANLVNFGLEIKGFNIHKLPRHNIPVSCPEYYYTFTKSDSWVRWKALKLFRCPPHLTPYSEGWVLKHDIFAFCRGEGEPGIIKFRDSPPKQLLELKEDALAWEERD
jgi:WD40 repeat protein